MRFEVFAAVRMMMFWVLAPCTLIGKCHFGPEDGDSSMVLQNTGIYQQVYTAPKPRRPSSSISEI
jgi:hypothetical protein